MNTKQVQYALKLAKSLNFSQVADELKISQPALSKQIINLEKDIGIQLFDRSSTPIKITPAGEYFLRGAEELLYKEDQLVRSMERFKSGEKGRLDIGISPFRSLYLIPSAIKKFQEKYPGIQVFLHEENSTTLRKEVLEGTYDFAIINLPIDEPLLHTIPLDPDTLVLVVPNNLLHFIDDTQKKDSKAIDFNLCQKLPFVVVGKHQEMRKLFDKLCAESNFHPNIVMEVIGLTTAWAMAQAGIGATLLPLQFINNNSFTNDVTLIQLKDTNYLRQPAIVYRRDQYVADYTQYAISLIKTS